jgi:hypothetical protein
MTKEHIMAKGRFIRAAMVAAVGAALSAPDPGNCSF